MIAVIDYGCGNITSLGNALSRLGAPWRLTSSEDEILRASHVILPGVGSAGHAMECLRSRGLDKLIPRLTAPTLGICIGMQLMCRHSEEDDAACLGIFPTCVRRLRSGSLKVPHVGWDTVSCPDTPEPGEWVYYVHSYAADLCPCTVGVTEYAGSWSAALRARNFMGVQFHPEKSGEAGARILQSFIELTY